MVAWWPCTVSTRQMYIPCGHGVRVLWPHGDRTYHLGTTSVYRSHTATVHTVWVRYLRTVATATVGTVLAWCLCTIAVCTIAVQTLCQHCVYLPWGHITLALWQHGMYGHRWIGYPATMLTQHTRLLCGHGKRAHCRRVDTHPRPTVDSSGTHSTSGTHFHYRAYPVLTSVILHTFWLPSCLTLSSPCIHIR